MNTFCKFLFQSLNYFSQYQDHQQNYYNRHYDDNYYPRHQRREIDDERRSVYSEHSYRHDNFNQYFDEYNRP